MTSNSKFQNLSKTPNKNKKIWDKPRADFFIDQSYEENNKSSQFKIGVLERKNRNFTFTSSGFNSNKQSIVNFEDNISISVRIKLNFIWIKSDQMLLWKELILIRVQPP